jgi:hypothetical protein
VGRSAPWANAMQHSLKTPCLRSSQDHVHLMTGGPWGGRQGPEDSACGLWACRDASSQGFPRRTPTSGAETHVLVDRFRSIYPAYGPGGMTTLVGVMEQTEAALQLHGGSLAHAMHHPSMDDSESGDNDNGDLNENDTDLKRKKKLELNRIASRVGAAGRPFARLKGYRVTIRHYLTTWDAEVQNCCHGIDQTT